MPIQVQPVCEKVVGLEVFLHEALRTLNSFQIFKIKIKKSKTYRGLCHFQGLSNGIPLRLDRTVPLILCRRFAPFQLILAVHALSLAHPADKIFFNLEIKGETVEIIISV